MDFNLDDEKIVIEKDGRDVVCDVLFSFDCEDTKKSYIGYTDNSFSNGKKNIYVNSFDPTLEKPVLMDVVDPRELEMVDDVLEKIKNGSY